MAKQYCKKMVYKLGDEVVFLFGLLTEENDEYVFFKTSKAEYQIRKSCILQIVDTNRIFKESASNVF